MSENYPEFKDTLTGSFSRQVFHQRFPEEIVRSLRYNSPLTLMVLDIDHFKSINDAFGHSRGDEILAEFIGLLKKQIRFTDLVFRYGGDEFIVLMLETSREAAVPVAERLLKSVRKHLFSGEPDISITLSIGLAECPVEATDPRGLFEKADSRLLEAKFTGRNRMVIDDTFQDVILPFEELSRLIERESTMKTIREFLDRIIVRKRGFLSIKGPQGSGISRLIREAVNTAKIMNFLVLPLQGNSLFRGHPFNALISVDDPLWKDRLEGADSLDTYIERIRSGIESDHQAKGLIVSADSFGDLDRPTREVIFRLINDSTFPIAGVISGDDTDGLARVQCPGNPIREMIELEPLSPEGLKIWLRSLLQWDPPVRFSSWIMRSTRGLPAYVKRALLYLVKREILQKNRNGGWTLKPQYQNIPLAQRIGLDTPPPPCNLPKDLQRFVGRKEEIRNITELLDHHRLITLLGSGGIGKTRLAIQIASEKHPVFEHGTFFVALAQLSSSEQILAAMAEVIGLRFHGPAAIKRQLLDFLQQKELLLIMDNTETVAAAPDIIADILTECPDVRMLCTSRERLNIHGETIVTITGLSFPERSDDPQNHEYSALKLFEQTAQNVDAAFSIDQDNLDDVIRICSLIHGIPLGIILAAPWVRLLSCGEIASEIEKSIDFLTTEQPNISERHRSLRAVFEYSWTGLSPDEQRIFSQLSVFHDGFSREAADRVAGAALHHLSSLLDKSLLYRTKISRFYILDILRQMAEEKLRADTGQFHIIRVQHCDYYAQMAKKLAQESRVRQGKDQVDIIAKEIMNFVAGWQYAAECGRYDLMSDYMSALFYYHEFSGLHEEGESILQWPVSRLENRVETDAGRDRDRKKMIADCSERCGSLSFFNSKYDQSEKYYREALALYESLGLSESAGMTINGLGTVALRRADLVTARSLLEQAIVMTRDSADHRNVMIVQNNMANVAHAQGDFNAAKTHYEAALVIARSTNDLRAEAGLLHNLSIIFGDLGDLLKKRAYLKDSLEMRKQMNDRTTSASATDSLANVEFNLGNFKEARKLHEESLALRRETGDQWGLAISLINIALESMLLDEFSDAEIFFNDGIAVCRRLGTRAELAFALAGLGHLRYVTGSTEQAWELLDQSLAMANEINFRYGLAWAKTNMGYVSQRQGRIDDSEGFFREALTIAAEIGMVPLVEEVLVGMADVLSEGSIEQKKLAWSILVYLQDTRPLSHLIRLKVEKLLLNLLKTVESVEAGSPVSEGKTLSLVEFAGRILNPHI